MSTSTSLLTPSRQKLSTVSNSATVMQNITENCMKRVEMFGALLAKPWRPFPDVLFHTYVYGIGLSLYRIFDKSTKRNIILIQTSFFLLNLHLA